MMHEKEVLDRCLYEKKEICTRMTLDRGIKKNLIALRTNWMLWKRKTTVSSSSPLLGAIITGDGVMKPLVQPFRTVSINPWARRKKSIAVQRSNLVLMSWSQLGNTILEWFIRDRFVPSNMMHFVDKRKGLLKSVKPDISHDHVRRQNHKSEKEP